jgi:hypothetical protein
MRPVTGRNAFLAGAATPFLALPVNGSDGKEEQGGNDKGNQDICKNYHRYLTG